MSIWRFSDWLPAVAASARLTLGEGNTPLVRSSRIGPAAGLANLFFKLESSNPTGSYKDRFAALGISQLVSDGKRRCLATSSGNSGSALAAYCALAGVPCQVAIVETAPSGKLQQMLAYGARLERIRGFGLDAEISRRAMRALQRLGRSPDCELLITAYACSPAAMAGVETLSFELAEQAEQVGLTLGHVFCPAGGGGLTLAVARGFERLRSEGRLARGPSIQCAQPEGNNTMAGPLRDGAGQARAVECTSAVSGLQVPIVLDGNEVIAACRASGGTGHVVSDAEVYAAQRRMAREEGIFCEPAAALALAAVLKAHEQRLVRPEAMSVCLVTGSGFKDPASVQAMIQDCDCPTIDVETIERLAAGGSG